MDLAASSKPKISGRDQAIVRVLTRVLVVNLAVAVGKWWFGMQLGLLSLTADALHSGLDASSNVVGIIGMKIASQPPDSKHPYGHRRFESIASLAIGILIALGLWELLRHALAGNPKPPLADPWAASFIALTVVINIGISRYETKAGEKHRSHILKADAGHTFSDALASLVVLAGIGGVALQIPWADRAAALVVSLFIARTAWKIINEQIHILVDSAQLKTAPIRQTAMSIPEVRGVHKIRSRGSHDHVAIDLHIQLDPNISLKRSHEITHQVTDKLHATFPQIADIIIHTEPE